MKLKYKLAQEDANSRILLTEDEKCIRMGGFVAGFEKARELLLEMEPWKERSWFEIPMSDLKNLGEQEVDESI